MADDRFLFRLAFAILHRARLDAVSPEASLRAEASDFLQSDFAQIAQEALGGIRLGVGPHSLMTIQRNGHVRGDSNE